MRLLTGGVPEVLRPADRPRGRLAKVRRVPQFRGAFGAALIAVSLSACSSDVEASGEGSASSSAAVASSTPMRPHEPGVRERAATAPSARDAPQQPVDPALYARDGSVGVYQFSAASGTWQCVIAAGEVGCIGRVPEARNPDMNYRRPDGIVLRATGESGMTAASKEWFTPRDESGRAVTAPELPAGRSLVVDGFVCTSLVEVGVQCETSVGDDGFKLLAAHSWMW